jgi:hypothetical protein
VKGIHVTDFNSEFKLDDIVYDIRGEEYVYVASAEDAGHLVRPVLLFDEDEQERLVGRAKIVSQVFRRAPTAAIDVAVAKLQAEKEELYEKVLHLKAEHKDLLVKEKDRLARLSRWKGMSLLDNFLQGKIVYIVK